jgi:hypothetical protein
LLGKQQDNPGAGQQAHKIVILGRIGGIGARLFKSIGKQSIERPDARDITGAKPTDGQRLAQIFTAVPLALTINIDPFDPITS